MTRVALLTEIPAPYRIPLFNALARRVDLRVAFLRAAHPDRPYELHREELRFAWRVLPGIALTIRGRWLVLNSGVVRSTRGADAVVLGGWNQPAFWVALLACVVRRTPALVWVESTGADRRTGRLDALKRRILRHAAGFLVPGEASRAYLAALGESTERITVAHNAVDAAVFAAGKRSRTDGRCRVLAVGRLAPEKGIDDLLAAAADLDVDVVLAGQGPEEARLRALAGPRVTFLGNVPRDRLADVYADADVFALPSRSEPWGMTLNEAALAGLPLVASSAAGATSELVEDGENGFRVPPGDVVALRRAIEALARDAELRQHAARRSREIAARLTPEAWADAVVSALERARR